MSNFSDVCRELGLDPSDDEAVDKIIDMVSDEDEE